MRVGTRISACVGVVCTALVIAGVALAAGAVTKVTIRPPNAKFGLHGRVFSRKQVCWVGRTIKVLRAKGPHEAPTTDTVAATTTSTQDQMFNQGFWVVSSRPKAGWYYSEAVRTSSCRRALSPLLHLTGPGG